MVFLQMLPVQKLINLIVTINLLVWISLRARNIQSLPQMALSMVIASASALLFSALPIAHDLVWSIIIKFQLKRQDHYFDLTIDLLYNALIIGVGVSIGILVSALTTVLCRDRQS